MPVHSAGRTEGMPPSSAIPLVSVVAATNRVSPFFAEALRSLAAQTYPRVEIIVVDDGSPDPSSVDATVAVAAPHARVLHRAAAGVSSARNAGAAAANGDLIVFFDDDDVAHPERIATQAGLLTTTPSAVACYCGLRTIDAQGRVLVEADQTVVADRLDIARRRTGILAPNLMVRLADFHAVGGFDPALSLAEDLDLVLKLSERGAFVFAPQALSDYRFHSSNNTSRHRELTVSIRHIVRAHLRAAKEAGDSALAGAHRESLRANSRFAWWGALRHARIEARAGRLAAAASDVLWALTIAPMAPLDAVARRLRRGD